MDAVRITKLKRIAHPKGDIQHALKSSDEGFSSFGEAYFTRVGKKDIKGWKKHNRMELNLIVPIGSVTFFVHDSVSGITNDFTLDSLNYVRLTIKPGVWVAFRGNDDLNLILNIASIEHDPKESINKDIESFALE